MSVVREISLQTLVQEVIDNNYCGYMRWFHYFKHYKLRTTLKPYQLGTSVFLEKFFSTFLLLTHCQKNILEHSTSSFC